MGKQSIVQRSVAKASKTVQARRVMGLSTSLVADVRGLIESARTRTAAAVNSELVLLYWQIGTRIRQDILREQRAEYGEQIVAALSRQLTVEYGSGFAEKSLHRMIQLADVFPDEQNVAALSRHLGWSHFAAIIPIDDLIAREFYCEMCRVERWSVRVLRDKIQSMLYERTAISRKPAELAKKELAALRDEDRMTPDLVFRDPYVLDFLGLADTYAERDIEAAILRELERFLLEMGSDFAFVARQKRVTVDGEDYYLDLLFFHRRLRRLVAIDLKLGRFRAADKGQMELYLRWLEQHERHDGEEPPVGMILCAGKSDEYVELLKLDRSGIRVAEYMVDLPPRELLEQKLHQAIASARRALAARPPRPAK